MTTAQPANDSMPSSKARQRVDVDVVRWLVKQEDVGFRFQGHGKVQSVAFTARKHAALLLLVSAVEIEPADVGAAVE